MERHPSAKEPAVKVMASRSISTEDLSCPICCDLYRDPVMLSCGHTLCRECLHQFWETKPGPECPLCRRQCSKKVNPPNLALRSLCDILLQDLNTEPLYEVAAAPTVVERGVDEHCKVHGERLKLFCLDDKQCVCVICRDSIQHQNHVYSPIEEVAVQLKKAVALKLEPLRKKVRMFESFKQTLDLSAQHNEFQAEKTSHKISMEFEKLHQFLRDEEAARIAALMEEKEKKRLMLTERTEKMKKEMMSLNVTIEGLEEQLKSDDIHFLQSYKSTVLSAQCSLQDPQGLPGALINVAKHLGNLKFDVWKKMQEMVQYTPVTLDSTTAHPRLLLSDDQCSIGPSTERKHQLPANPERADLDPSVLGSEALDSGIHCWDVEVAEAGDWLLGVQAESSPRRGDLHSRPGLWCMGKMGDVYTAGCSPQTLSLLTVKQTPQRVRVQLDWDKGKVSFSDPDSNTHLHTLTHTFTGRVYPYFNTGCVLKIMPVRIRVSVEEDKWKERRLERMKCRHTHMK